MLSSRGSDTPAGALSALQPLVPLSRGEFMSRIGLMRQIDPMTEEAYYFAEMQEAGKSDQGHGMGDPWHIAFHGSEFPGDNPVACGRHAIYRLMDIPRGVAPRKLRQQGDAGKDIEIQIVRRWHRAGYLLTPSPDERQMQFEDPAHWLTSTVDAITLPLKSRVPIVTEVKSKSTVVIEAMKKLIRGPDAKHVRQVKAQIGLAHEKSILEPMIVQRCHNSGRLAVKPPPHKDPFCPEHLGNKCLEEVELDPVRYGRLYYVSRDDPSDTFEFFFEYDPRFMDAGREKLHEWKGHFLAGTLPQTNFEAKRFAHPFGWQWTKEEYPCKYCDFGSICREDTQAAIKAGEPIKLSDSNAVETAKEIRPEYSLDRVRKAIFERWNVPVKDAGEKQAA